MSAPESPDGPLSGIVVADFSRVLAGPLASMILGDLGATVIKVERPETGDETRSWGPPYAAGVSTYYLAANRNKRSIVLDLATDAGAAAAVKLAERADVLIENFLPGQLKVFGLDAESVLRRSPGLVYCSITGFGTHNAIAGYDFVVQAVGGLMSITGEPDGGQLYKVGVAVVDVLSALNAVIAIQAALSSRERTGKGQHVSVNLLSSLLSSLANQVSSFINTGEVPRALGNRHPSVVPYETIETADGMIALAVGTDRQFALMCDALGRGELSDDERFSTNAARVRHHDELITELRTAFAARPSNEWLEFFAERGIPAGAVNDLAGAVALAEQLGLHPLVTFPTEGEESIATIASALTLASTPVSYRLPPPRLGEHTEEVLAWLDNQAELRD